MANTFFGFNTALNDAGERLSSSPEDCEGLEAEEEYDALNDETFGALEAGGDLDDWEVQHEQLAEIAESSRHSNDIESFLDNLETSDDDNSTTSNDRTKQVEKLFNDLLHKPFTMDQHMIDTILSFAYVKPKGARNNRQAPRHASARSPAHTFNQQSQQPRMPISSPSHRPPPGILKLQTVEELERSLINQSKSPNQANNSHGSPFPHHGFREAQGPRQEHHRFPPGFQPLPQMGMGPGPMWPPHPYNQHSHMPPGGSRHPPPGGSRHPPHLHGPPMPPPGVVLMMGNGPPHPRMHTPPPHMMPRVPPPPPGFMYGHTPNHLNSGFPMNPPQFNLPPPAHMNMPPGMHPPPQRPGYPMSNTAKTHLNNQQQDGRVFEQGYQHNNEQGYQYNRQHTNTGADIRDEYVGLMNNREKQWLLNIQLLQINTGTPFFDDYYYTVFKERQSKNKENVPEYRNQNQRYHNNRYQHRDGNAGHHRNSSHDERQDNAVNPLQKKINTPLQFENSLGKLQFGSVTAPRKIIDMDIITLEKDLDSTQSSRDSRKTKQLLLELESLYSLILKAEDLKNPVAISNSEKLVELKQKQRLREIDAAQTAEQKQDILKLLQQESVAPIENQSDILAKIISALLQDDKLQSFLCIRKGKMLLLRIIPHISNETYLSHLIDIWNKFLLSIPLVGRRDTMGDNILPRFYPLFKRFMNTMDMDQILDMSTNIIEIIKFEHNNRSTPMGYQTKPPIHFMLQNKFGISTISVTIQRVDTLLATWTDKQHSDWSNFVTCLCETLLLVGAAAAEPLEPISDLVLHRTAEKTYLSDERKELLEKIFVK